MKMKIERQNKLMGEIVLPGDKSISHRAIILGSLASGKTKIRGFLEAEDCLQTIDAFRALGVTIKRNGEGEYLIDGAGLHNLREPGKVIDCGNSGTCMRLLCGLLAAQNFYSVLTGDSSLRQRPMKRIIDPLSRMGARIWSRKGNYAPLSINGEQLEGINYNLPVASAQVKSSLLLAGLYTDQDISLTEPGPSRDHTERMLINAGVNIKIEGNSLVMPGQKNRILQIDNIEVPADISSASYFLAAGLLVEKGNILLKNIGINKTRNGILEVIQKMQGNIDLFNKHTVNSEPIADIRVRSSNLKGVKIEGDLIPRLIDEIPVIAVLAARAEGETVIRDAHELRVKETDRITATVNELKKMGVDMRELEDGMIIKGPSNIKGDVELNSYGDHRIAMALTIAGLLADKPIKIKNYGCVRTSFPNFTDLLDSLL